MGWDHILYPLVKRSVLLSYHATCMSHTTLRLITYRLTKTENSHIYCQRVKDVETNRLTTRILLQPTSTWVRHYAKGKDRGKDKKSDKTKRKVTINEEQLEEVIKVETMRLHMQKAVDNLKEEYIKNISLRSTTGSIENLLVSFDGKQYELQELAQVVRKNPKTIVINMLTFPQAIPAALQALEKSGMNLNPQQDGTTLFIPIPKITKEHRENLAKNAKTHFIKCRDSIKDVQNKFIKKVKNNTTISQDFSHEVQEQIVSIGEQYIAEGETIFQTKQTELIGKE